MERVYTYSSQTEAQWVKSANAGELRSVRDEAQRDLRFDFMRLIDAELLRRGLVAPPKPPGEPR